MKTTTVWEARLKESTRLAERVNDLEKYIRRAAENAVDRAANYNLDRRRADVWRVLGPELGRLATNRHVNKMLAHFIRCGIAHRIRRGHLIVANRGTSIKRGGTLSEGDSLS